MIKKIALSLIALIVAGGAFAQTRDGYEPTAENLAARQEFADHGFGIFIHWGVYSMFGQGEWFLNNGIRADEYAKAARGFYPADFDAAKWVAAFKDAGAKYICITTRHHDGFSMFKSEASPYNIVDATPFGRDIIAELAEECQRQGIKLHFYYSHVDWTREDYPIGRVGLETGRDTTKGDYNSYFNFMNAQITELLTNYGEIGALWFDGIWDHDLRRENFDWRLNEQYALIHSLQPRCLIGNNHHLPVFDGEDIQIFERDLPGENKGGFSKDAKVSALPLESCETMNRTWGYNIKDTDYKDTPTLIRLLVRSAGLGANLLLNVGPQPNGEIPAAALEHLAEMGEWMRSYGETIYATTKSDFEPAEWGTSTRKGDKLYVHVLDPTVTEVSFALDSRVKSATAFDSREAVKFSADKKSGNVTLHLPEIPEGCVDYIVELELNRNKQK